MKRRFLVLLSLPLALCAVGSLGSVLFAAGCGGSAEPELCGQIPLDGCPLGRGGTCDDPLCAALYDCAGGTWILTEACPSFGGGGGAGGTGAGGAGAGGCATVTFDRSNEVSGCTPDLQSPDCPASAAEVCISSACLTDCLDFFLCTKDGWVDVAHCDLDGNLMIVPQ